MFTREMEIVSEKIKSLIELLPMLNTIENQLKEHDRDLDLIADVTFLAHKTEEVFDTIQKRFNALKRQAAAQADNIFPFLPEEKKGNKKYTNERCTISSASTFYVKYPADPSKDGYKEFVAQLPIEAVRPHYPTVSELITKKLEEGEQIPFGLPKFGIISLEPKLRLTSKKEL